MSGFGVILNPHAGQNRRAPERLSRLEAIVGDTGIVCAPSSYEELDQAVATFRDRQIEVLAICGGDGSFFRILSALVNAYGDRPLPMVLPLRAGSMNTVARSVGCRHGSPERVLSAVIADHRAGRPFELTERQLIRIGTSQYGFMVGAGAIVSFLQVYYALPHSGPLPAAWLLTRLLASVAAGTTLSRGILQQLEADVDCDGERVPHRRFNVIYASSIRDIGLGFYATYLATRKRGYYHLLAGRLSPMQMLRRFWRIPMGFPLDYESLYDNLAQDVHVEFAKPTHYMIDGDVLEAVSSFEMSAGPRLTIIRK